MTARSVVIGDRSVPRPAAADQPHERNRRREDHQAAMNQAKSGSPPSSVARDLGGEGQCGNGHQHAQIPAVAGRQREETARRALQTLQDFLSRHGPQYVILRQNRLFTGSKASLTFSTVYCIGPLKTRCSVWRRLFPGT